MAQPTNQQLQAAYTQLVADTRQRVLEYATSHWDSLDNYRGQDIDQLLEALVPRIQAGQLRVAQLTDTYLAAVTGNNPGWIDETTLGNGARDAIDIWEQYHRPGTTVYANLAKGINYANAVIAGRNRLAKMVATDLQLAKTKQAHYSMSLWDNVRGYKRVPKGIHTCALCLLASTQRYRKDILMPIHPGCDCGIEPLTKTDLANAEYGDNGALVLDPDLRDSLHAQISQQTGIKTDDLRDGRNVDYRKLMVDLVEVREHGEIGPVLTWKGQPFTSANQLPAKPDPAENNPLITKLRQQFASPNSQYNQNKQRIMAGETAEPRKFDPENNLFDALAEAVQRAKRKQNA